MVTRMIEKYTCYGVTKFRRLTDRKKEAIICLLLVKDGYKCSDCSTPCNELKYKIEIDHIDNNPLNDAIENLRLVCKQCNIKKGWHHNFLSRYHLIGYSKIWRNKFNYYTYLPTYMNNAIVGILDKIKVHFRFTKKDHYFPDESKITSYLKEKLNRRCIWLNELAIFFSMVMIMVGVGSLYAVALNKKRQKKKSEKENTK